MTRLPNDFILGLSNSLLSATDSSKRAGLVAEAVVALLGDGACVVHQTALGEDGPQLSPIALAGPVSLSDGASPGDSRLPRLLSGELETILISGSELRREDTGHLHAARSIVSLAYISLRKNGQVAGALELLTFSSVLEAADLATLEPIASLAAPAIVAAQAFERQRQDLLDSVHRMSQLYDLEKSLNATLELDNVIALASRKAAAMLSCQALHLWMFDGALLRLMATSGHDETVQIGETQAAGQGYVGDMAEEGDPLIIDDPADHRLQLRNAALGDPPASPPVASAMLVPLLQDEAEVGVLEAINRADGKPFDDDDQFFLAAIAETVSSALKNASLMNAERKLEILQALVHVSAEITSTLRLDRLLPIVVNGPQNVLPYERCAIALDQRGSLQLKAVSGMANIPLGDATVDRLHDLMRWLSTQITKLHLRQDEADLPAEVALHFDKSGFSAIYALPLSDDQGRVGLLLYEASDPDFLTLPHVEMIKILAGQATVAIRNALLYREVPLISLLEPLLQRKQAILRSGRGRKLVFAGVTAAVFLFLLLCPLPMRVSGQAVVAPQHLVTIAAPLDGNVAAVYAHEGQRVVAGELLGEMNDWQWRSEVSSADARSRAAEMAMGASLASGSMQAGADRAQAEFLRAEAARARRRAESAQLRSPIDGVVSTPMLQNLAGRHLNAGDSFAQVLDLSYAVVSIAVPQSEVSLVRPGQAVSIKLDSYPQRSWHGGVNVISPQAEASDSGRTFAARVSLPNTDATLRAGMTGKAKIFVGFRPAAYVLLRAPALWAWQTLWNWIGW